ncbi:MAG: toxin-activating lysine-acyltransferase [Alphaproteobacteria bacterium]|nr:toxin-activating lysine-acyltransferase [Alphaproteobacteria bacterium]
MALLLQSPGHRHLFLADLEWQLLPPLGLGQFRVWRKDLMPVITASWAFVSPEVDARLCRGQVKLAPQEWKSGTILWLMDIICPYGGMAEAVKELKSQVFQEKLVKTLQPAPDGSMGVVTW